MCVRKLVRISVRVFVFCRRVRRACTRTCSIEPADVFHPRRRVALYCDVSRYPIRASVSSYISVRCVELLTTIVPPSGRGWVSSVVVLSWTVMRLNASFRFLWALGGAVAARGGIVAGSCWGVGGALDCLPEWGGWAVCCCGKSSVAFVGFCGV